VKLTVQVQILPTAEQRPLLLDTLRTANTACDYLSEQAWKTKVFGQYAIHRAAYHACRVAFPSLSSQVVIRCIAKVADAYKLDRKVQRTFRPLGAIAYDCRILSWKVEAGLVSIWTIGGRQSIAFVCGERQRELLNYDRGEADLVHRDGRFYLLVCVDLPDTEENAVTDFVGVDLGVIEIAATSDGKRFAGKLLNKRRARNYRLRKRLQSKGTRSARRLLRKRRRKERRFSVDVNHCIAKELVEDAKRTGRGIALEDLTHIRDRIRATRAVRRQLHSWAFADLATKISYKANLAGVPVQIVDPRNTSRTCAVCGHCEKANRRSRDRFHCRRCGHTAHADENGAENIRRKALAFCAAAVNRPYAPGDDVVTSGHATRTSTEPDVASRRL
jgi:IS605 OrfB family transposase